MMAAHDGKNCGRSEGAENFGEFPVTVGGRALSDACFSHTRTCVGARHWALTEPERGVRLLNPSDCTAGYALLNPSDSFATAVLTEADRTLLPPSLDEQ